MERVVERGCGLDVSQKTVAACVRVPAPNGGRQELIRTFGTMTAELLALRDWLLAHDAIPLDVQAAWKARCDEALELIAVSARQQSAGSYQI